MANQRRFSQARKTIRKQSASGSNGTDIAVIGLACRFPGARDYRQFWENLVSGVDSITEIPADRWDWRAYWGDPQTETNKTNSKWGGFIADVDKFDASFFNISPREAELMDPQQRLLLELSYACLEDAGYKPSNLTGSDTGVFIGICNYDYKELQERYGRSIEGHLLTGTANTIVPNRLSYFFNWHGPSVSVDTACSSSLVALHQAVRAMAQGECQLCLVGGINILVSPGRYIPFSKLNMLSPTGRCRTFDEAADGYVRGEGAGVILLKRLEQAINDSDPIYGIIKGSAVNHGGQARTLTSPNAFAQSQVIVEACQRAGVSPASLSYIETHGTGTPLGDPIEIHGLKRAFGQLFKAVDQEPRVGYCGLGAVKSNIGHLEAAAGIAGVIKVLLAMKHKTLPGTPNFTRLNPRIKLAKSPFYLIGETTDWDALRDEKGDVLPHRAGVSSFGFGGTNAHVVLEAYRGAEDQGARGVGAGPQMILLSARNEDRLRAQAQQMLAFVEKSPDISLVEMAYTLQVGREAMDSRLALVVTDIRTLGEKLTAYLMGKIMVEGGYQGEVRQYKEGFDIFSQDKDSRAMIRQWLAKGKLDKLAAGWVKGVAIDWTLLYNQEKPRRISLPTYPFERKRYWFDSYQASPKPVEAGAVTQTILARSERKEQPVWESEAMKQAAHSYQGQAVQMQVIDETIALVTMTDTASKNMFSEELMRGLYRQLFEVQQNKQIKAVILTGYDNIFCMGGSQESLVEIAERRRNFTDMPLLYRGLLELEVPVITAMQGHAFGGGLLFGLYGDMVVMSKTGVYSANFMKYGFTPGMGATYILGEKLGQNLATEMMYTATMFEGAQLKARGASVIVCDQQEVLKEALRIARQLARKPRQALTVLKKELSGRILKELLGHIEREVEMHTATFGTDEVKAAIATHFEQVKGRGPQRISLKEVEALAIPAVVGPEARQTDKLKLVTPISRTGPQVTRQKTIRPVTPDKPTPVRPAIEPVKARLTAILQGILHLEGSEIDDQTVFQELGVDSIGGVEIIREVNKTFGLHLEAVTLYDQYNLDRLSRFIEQELANQPLISSGVDQPTETTEIAETGLSPVPGVGEPTNNLPAEALEWLASDEKPHPQVTTEPGTTGQAGATDIAIIGMSGRFPGADDLETFWQNLANGVDSISPVPAHKWDMARYYDPDPHTPGKSYSRWLGSLADEDKFDAAFFNISPREAERMDVQQRLFLEEAWKALEDAAYAPHTLSETRCSIYVGVGQGDYHHNLRAETDLDAHTFMGLAPSILTARLAYHLNLKGASLAIDTACSSSLVAIHKACQSLLSGESELALAGGVYVGTTPEMHILTSKALMLASDGRCKTFDNRADGFVIGEGVGVAVLKKLEQAIFDGDAIYGVIKGSGINQDGKTNGLTAPSVESQQQLETQVYEQAGIDPNSITLVEAHGTGTKLGDPIEVRALTNAFRQYTDATRYCAIGSVKTNIGHTLTAAGVAGVIKVLLALKHKKLPPSLHFETPNAHVDFENSPFYVNTGLKDWAVETGPRRAAVSSFGFSGTNAHLVIEEYQESGVRNQELGEGPQLIVLSAKNEERLKAYGARLLAFLERASTIKPAEQKFDRQEHTPTLEDTVRTMVSDITGGTLVNLEIEQAFEGYGLDPVQLSRLKTMVEERYHCDLPLTLVSGQASVERIAQHLASLAAEDGRNNQATSQSALSLASIAYTLQVGREAMECRLALVVSSVEELIERLSQYQQKKTAIEHIYQGNTKASYLESELLIGGEAGEAFIKIAIRNRELDRLAHLWVSGVELDWSLLYGREKPRRISLPTYPFARERYWLPNNEQYPEGTSLVISNKQNYSFFTPALPEGQAVSVLHPLVHRNISTLTEQRFSSLFTGTEFFLTNHQVQGQKVLPGVAYLEMARAAGTMAVENEAITQIKDVVWARPIVVKAEPLEVQLGLYPDEKGGIAFEVSSSGEVHSYGKLVVGEVSLPKSLDIAAIEDRCLSTLDGTECYRRFEEQGLVYGPAFQGVAQLSYNEREALARLRLPSGGSDSEYGLNPSLMDAALQTILGLSLSQPETEPMGLCLPFAVRVVTIYGSLPEKAYAYVTYSAGVEPGAAKVSYDIDLTDEQGAIRVQLKGLTVRVIPESAENDLLYSTPDWQIKLLAEGEAAPSEGYAPDSLLLVGLEPAVAEAIGSTFTQTEVIKLDPANVTALVQQSWQHLKAIVDKKSTSRAYQILVVAADTVDSHIYAPLVGLLKTARLEQPQIRGKIIAVSKPTVGQLRSLLERELRVDSFQDVEISYDETGTRAVKTLRELEINSPAKPAYLKPGGVYWLTGGLGGLGRIFARHLLDQGEQITIILSGRSKLDDIGQQHLAELNRLGGMIVYLPADVSVKAEVEQVVQTITKQYGHLNGIIHSAGVIKDSFIINKTAAEIEAVLAPKVTGTLNIDAVTQAEPLDFMVLFSSLAGVLGNVGQADYAAANAFLDGFAHHRQALVEAGQRSGRTLSINWPLWAQGGMAADSDTEAWLANRTGFRPLSTEAGIKAFEQLLAQEDYVQLLAAQGDRTKIRRSLGLAQVNRPPPQPIPVGCQVAGAVEAQVENELIELCMDLLKVKRLDLDVETNLAEYGVDSILMMRMLNRLEAVYGVTIAPTALVDYPTIRALAGYLISQGIVGQDGSALKDKAEAIDLKSDQSPTAARSSTFTARRKSRFRQETDRHSSGQVAIIAQACRLPQSPSLERFWSNLIAGRDLVTTVPADRWQAEAFYSPQPGQLDKTYSNHGAFIDDIGYFDAGYFGIAEEEAITIDPQQRIILELAQELWDRAGYRIEEVAGTNTGIFIGAKDNNYVRNHYHLIPQSAVQHSLVNTISNMIAARVSDFYNLTGTAQVLDTACSASLVAVHDACRSLLSGESELAIAGGIFLMVDAFNHIGFSQARVLSVEGRSYVFDERANGFVLGEGGGLVLLKEYEAAVRDSDQILGVILGSAVNNDGHTMGLTVPNQAGQKAVIKTALRRSQIDPAEIGYLEAHGTGTLLGDPIEIRAATEVYRQYTPETQYCAVGSVKSNLGHTMTAAGITGLIKLILSLQHQQIPATLHCEKPHPRFKFDESPFYPNTRLRDWEPRNGRRVGAISSFGFGGTNCHLIVAEGRQVHPIRQPLPLTQFKRKRYWLGQEIVSEIVDDFDEEYYRTLIESLQNGELSRQTFSRMIISS